MNIDFTLAGAVIITGLVVVFVALIGLSLIVWLIGKLFVSTGLGSPKKPALLEALALNFADNTDAKMETMIEALNAGGENTGWLGYNRLLETNIRKTTEL